MPQKQGCPGKERGSIHEEVEEKPQEFRLLSPDTCEKTVLIQFTSPLGFSGSQAFVRPAVITAGDSRFTVQVKRFYQESFDDRGGQFTQDPQKEVEKSYEALRFLRDKSFKVIPFFAIATDALGQKLLILSDLRDGETREVYDEKDIHRSRSVTQVIDGREYKVNARIAVDNLENKRDISLAFLHTDLLQIAYGVDLGFGVVHMVVRDPETNLGEVFVTDVGEMNIIGSKYKEAVYFEELIAFPEEEIFGTFSRMLKAHYPKADAKALFNSYRTSDSNKREFQNLFYKAGLGYALRSWIGGWAGDPEWARDRFVRNTFTDHFMRVKWGLQTVCDSYESATGDLLWEINQNAHGRFVEGRVMEDLLVGIDFAYLAALDRRMQYLVKARELVDRQQEITLDLPPVIFEDGFPRMEFFDNFNEAKGQTCIVRIKPHILMRDVEVEVALELDWNRAYSARTSGGMTQPFFLPEELKGVWVNDRRIEDFDSSEVHASTFMRRDLKVGDWVNYYHREFQVGAVEIKTQEDLKKAKLLFSEKD